MSMNVLPHSSNMRSRLKEVSCEQQLPSDTGIDLLRQATQGNPRQAGVVIQHVMCLAVPKGLNHLPDDLVQQGIKELCT